MQRWKHILIHMALFAFVLNALLPFFAVYNASAKIPATPTAFQNEKILICSGDGFKWVTYQELQNEKQKHNAPTSHFQCALCFLAAHGLNHLALPGEISPEYAATTSQAPRLSFHAPGVARDRLSLFHSRAPPSPFFS